MNKKIMLTLIVFLIIITSIGIGYYIIKIQSMDIYIDEYNSKISEEKITDECVEEGKDFLQANSHEDKVSPNAIIIEKIYYDECGHTTKRYLPVDSKIVNLSENEVKNLYNDYEIESFSPNEIVIKKSKDGICGEHYLLKEEDEKIVVYLIDEEKNEVLVEKTEIITKYLPETDRINIKNGIYVNGKEALNCLLEDYE